MKKNKLNIDIDIILEMSKEYSSITKLSKKYCKKQGIEFTDSYRAKISKILASKGSTAIKKPSVKTKTDTSDYKNKKEFVLSAWNTEKGYMMDMNEYCSAYKLPRKDVSSYKLVSHTGTPFYNIAFRETITDVETIDFESLFKKHTENVKQVTLQRKDFDSTHDFDTLTYTDLHVAMDTNKFKNSMYPILWNTDEVIKLSDYIVTKTIENKKSDMLIIDDLGDLLDGFNGLTTRGGHSLPQNMTNEEAFDTALSFKMNMLKGLVGEYASIKINNICNDNHSGAFGYFVNSAMKQLAEKMYENVEVVNHRQFINHYYVNNVAFVITHGKDDKDLKFGFKPNLDTKAIEKIDQYCKNKEVYLNSKLVIFKKGDSHQALFDMCSSDDFYYYNYPAASPSSSWVQSNFKKGRRGFVLENFKGTESNIKTIFIK